MNVNGDPTPSPTVTYDTRGDVYVTHHDMSSSAQLSTTVVHAVADVFGEDVSETEFTLYDVVDPDALDRLFAPTDDGRPRAAGQVTFSVRGCQVTVDSTGQIRIRPPARTASTPGGQPR